MNWLWELLAKPEVQTIVVMLIGLIIGTIKNRQAAKKWKLGVVLDALEIGVRQTYESYVRAAKASARDGKLGDGQRQVAVESAIQTAREYASSKGIDLLKFYGREYLPVIIEKIVGRNKMIGKIAGVLPPPFVEPQLPLG